MNAAITETIKSTMLGLSEQNIEILGQLNFVSTKRQAHKLARNLKKILRMNVDSYFGNYQSLRVVISDLDSLDSYAAQDCYAIVQRPHLYLFKVWNGIC